MRFVIGALVALSLIAPAQAAGVAFFKAEQVTGQTKICIYTYMGSSYAITIKAYQVCPYSIRVP